MKYIKLFENFERAFEPVFKKKVKNNFSIYPKIFKIVDNFKGYYNKDSVETIMYQLNDIVGGYGVEEVKDGYHIWDFDWGDVVALYVNLAWQATIIYDAKSKKFDCLTVNDYLKKIKRKPVDVQVQYKEENESVDNKKKNIFAPLFPKKVKEAYPDKFRDILKIVEENKMPNVDKSLNQFSSLIGGSGVKIYREDKIYVNPMYIHNIAKYVDI